MRTRNIFDELPEEEDEETKDAVFVTGRDLGDEQPDEENVIPENFD